MSCEIKKISIDEANKIIELREPLGLFYAFIPDEYSHKLYVGIDNIAGDAWTEDFKNLGSCKRWLKDENLKMIGAERIK